MKRWPLRQMFGLVLGVFVAVGMSLSVVQAADMAAKMATASDMGAFGHDGCNGCGNNGDADGAKTMACMSVCVAPILAVLPQVSLAAFDPPRSPTLRSHARLFGHESTPDPYPPRPSTLG